MLEARIQKTLSIPILLVTISIISFPAYAKYSGGTGEPGDPYQIATAADLIALGESPEDYGKNFILTADIDLAPNLPGGKVFEKAVIAPDAGDPWGDFQNIPFTGIFDGSGHTISNLTITGKNYLGLFGELGTDAKIMNSGIVNVSITASGDNIGALVGKNSYGTVTQCYSSGGTISGKGAVGGLVGSNCYGYIISCYSTSTVNSGSGELEYIGGLVGYNSYGTVAQCRSTGVVGNNSYTSSEIAYVGGLVGFNSYGTVTQCYSTSTVKGNNEMGGLVGTDSFGKITKSYSSGSILKTGPSELPHIGGLIGSCLKSYVYQCYSTTAVSGRDAQGLVGQLNYGVITSCFWDTQASGYPSGSNGGIGKTTSEMKTLSTFTNAGWDFVGENANGTDDIWRICEPPDYPRLVWQMQTGDFACPDGITMTDFDFFMEHYGDTNCNQSNGYCSGTDLNLSGTVDMDDYEILLNLWLAGNL